MDWILENIGWVVGLVASSGIALVAARYLINHYFTVERLDKWGDKVHDLVVKIPDSETRNLVAGKVILACEAVIADMQRLKSGGK